jgi:hypothetical protein
LENTGTTEGIIRFQGGDLHAKSRANPDSLTADDFRLRPDSAGYQAGPDDKDLGANIDLVGPGEAYERWKETPEYQQWQKASRELLSTTSAEQRDADAAIEPETTDKSSATNREDDQKPVEEPDEEQRAPSDS